MKHYKVVREFTDGLYSSTVYGHAIVRYVVNEWVHAPRDFNLHGYHLLVFTRLSAARDFIYVPYQGEGVKIYEVKVRGVVALPTWRYEVNRVSTYSIRELEKVSIQHEWPKHTRMAREVKLIRIVE